MKRMHFIAAILIGLSVSQICLAADAAPVAIPARGIILANLKQGHPRLLADAVELNRLKDRISTDTTLRRWHAELKAQAEEKILNSPPSAYEIPDGLRLLSTSRRVLWRVQTLGLLHRLEGDPKFAARAWSELEAAANFPDWNPRHFLDTAEMTHAFAIGYDWLYDVWSPAQRKVLRTAIVEKGLNPALGVYRGTHKYSGWPKVRHNWNQVCNGGIGMGALAVADEEPELAAEILEFALKSIQLPMAEFAPDGAWAEGPGYWNYATSYNVVFLAALETALGTDFRLSEIPGFSEAGTFPIYLTGPLGRTFNYADGSDGRIRGPQMFWLARKFQVPAYAAYAREVASPHPLDLVWARLNSSEKSVALPLDKHFGGAGIVTMRSGWNDRDALFVGFKAGDNKANHSNLDLGTFVFDALGVRWAVDLGADNYNLPGYFGKQRWTYYRMRAEGHNTLVINSPNGPDQDPAAAAKIVRFVSMPERAFAVADFTAAYANHARKVSRGVALLGRKQLLVQDEIETDAPSEIRWFFHTPAAIEIAPGGSTATLTQGTKKLLARILSPAGAAFNAMAAEPLESSPRPEKQNPNRDVRKLGIHLKNAQSTQLTVLLTPVGESGQPSLPQVRAIKDW